MSTSTARPAPTQFPHWESCNLPWYTQPTPPPAARAPPSVTPRGRGRRPGQSPFLGKNRSGVVEPSVLGGRQVFIHGTRGRRSTHTHIPTGLERPGAHSPLNPAWPEEGSPTGPLKARVPPCQPQCDVPATWGSAWSGSPEGCWGDAVDGKPIDVSLASPCRSQPPMGMKVPLGSQDPGTALGLASTWRDGPLSSGSWEQAQPRAWAGEEQELGPYGAFTTPAPGCQARQAPSDVPNDNQSSQ